jgi:hypothetical protein
MNRNLLEEIVLAERVGLDSFGIGEDHRGEFVDSAPAVILGAAACFEDYPRYSTRPCASSANLSRFSNRFLRLINRKPYRLISITIEPMRALLAYSRCAL